MEPPAPPSQRPLSRAIILCGPSSSGKTTLAKALQETLLPAVWLAFSVDSIVYSLPGSVLERCNQANDWTGVDGNALFAGALGCVRALTANGNSVIFDAVVTSDSAAGQLIAETADANPFVVALTCPWSELKRRTLARGDRTIGEAAFSFNHAAGHLRYHLEINTAHLAPQEAAEALIEEYQAWNEAGCPPLS